MPRRGTIRNPGRVARELADARRERARQKKKGAGEPTKPTSDRSSDLAATLKGLAEALADEAQAVEDHGGDATKWDELFQMAKRALEMTTGKEAFAGTPDQKPAANHADYAEEAEAAERAEAWPQAAALWLRASETCGDVDRALGYVRSAEACKHRHAVDSKLEQIAKNVLKVPTLKYRHSDGLDFHELSVGQIKLALRAAYEAGRASAK